jgi:hypothetical protein
VITPDGREAWVFTFGFSHVHPFTGESLASAYVIVPGTVTGSRARMLDRFGRGWSHQYRTPADAGVEKYGLREIDWIETVFREVTPSADS